MRRWTVISSRFEPERRRRVGHWLVVLLVGLVTLFAPRPRGALADEPGRWTVTALGGVATSAGDSVEVRETQGGPIVFGRATHRLEDGSGFGLGLSYLATRRVGFELGVSWYDFDTELAIVSDEASGGVGRDRQSVEVETFYAMVSYHLRPGRRLDVSLGLLAAMSKPEDIVFRVQPGQSGRMAFDDDVGFGAVVRVDLALSGSGRWLLAAEIRALEAIFESEHSGQDLDFDPITAAVGLAYRW